MPKNSSGAADATRAAELPSFTQDDVRLLEELCYETRGQRAMLYAIRGPVGDIDARIAALKSLTDRIMQFRAQRGPTADSGEAEE